jgi:MoaA/NifB/PqqE/SkfB family radical SAM enzyme
MFSYDSISEYQLEITSHCNAACPQCPRNLNGGKLNPYMPLKHLDRAVIAQTFDQDLVQRISQIFFCGSYGDPIMHPEFLEILQDFRAKNPQVWLYIHTNGGVHDTKYWTRMAKILAGYGKIDFGIDGLSDTNDLYRQNVKFKKVMANAQAFIDAGGRAQWNCIVFEHNDTQLDEISKLSFEMGFVNVQFRSTGRFFNHKTMETMDQWPVQKPNGHVARWLRPTVEPQYQNKSIQRLPAIREQYDSWKDYFTTTNIKCDALQGKKVAINCEGLVLPCNFFNHNLYDARFYDDQHLPHANELSFVDGNNQVRKFLENYGLDKLNIHNHTLQEIFDVPMWADLVKSFERPLGQGRLFECAMTCGEKFTKVWDQGTKVE